MQTLRQIEEGDILFYIDIGCEFQIEGREKLKAMVEQVRQNEIMGVRIGGAHFEKTWTKASVFQHFGVLENARFTDTKQIASGFVLLRKTQKSQEIIKEWLQIFYTHFHLVDDSPSSVPNYEGFIENRHDQSIWSMINKKYGMKNFDDLDFTQKGVDKEEHPIVVTRNKLYLDYDCDYSLLQTLKAKSESLKKIFPTLTMIGKLHPLSEVRKSARTLKGFISSL